jgi:hypothetical protein
MADDYLEFSQVVANLSEQEADGLRQDLAMIDVYGDQEFGAGTGNIDGKLGVPDWSGYRFLRDYPELDADADEVGFGFSLEEDGDAGRHLWLYSDEYADLAKLGHLIQRFLRRFRPHDCWALSYACTCSKPRIDAFGGGAVFITSRRITFDNSWDLIDRKRQTFERRRQPKPRPKKRTPRKP